MIKSMFSMAGIFFIALPTLFSQELFKAPPDGTETRWVSPENLSGAKGQGGKTNKGAKGNAFYIIAPGEKKYFLMLKEQA